jgi:hypothetical protein
VGGIVSVLSKHSGPGEGLQQKGGGYFQVPDLVFDLELTANEKLVLIYFMRRADREGRSFPSVERICRDCGFKAQNTVRRAVKGLEKQGLLRVVRTAARSNRFYVAGWLYEAIGKGKAGYIKNGIASPAARNDDTGDNASLRGSVVRDRGNLTDMSTVAEAPLSHMTDFTASGTNLSRTPSLNEAYPSSDEVSTLQNMKPKEYTVEGSAEKEYTVSLKDNAREKTKRVHEEACASSSQPSRSDDNSVTMLDVANHMDTLSPEERRRFDAEALKLGKPGEPDPRENLWQKRLLRVRYLRRLREGVKPNSREG